MKRNNRRNALDKRAAGTLFIDTAKARDSQVKADPASTAWQIVWLTMVGAVNIPRNRAAIRACRLDGSAMRTDN